MNTRSGLAAQAIDEVLELSAEAHIQRKTTTKGSPDFHRRIGVIAAYGNSLAVLVALQEREELCALITELNLPASLTKVAH